MHTRSITRLLTAAIATLSSAGFVAGGSVTTQASANAPLVKAGNASIVESLDGGAFDDTARDFDIAAALTRYVLKERPDSPVGLMTQGNKRATFFAPTDFAFMTLVEGYTGEEPRNEKVAYRLLIREVSYLGELEDILLYHLVPGKTLGKKGVVAAPDGRLHTAVDSSQTLRVKVRDGKVILIGNHQRSTVTRFGVNKGNKQKVHRVNRVLVPIGR